MKTDPKAALLQTIIDLVTDAIRSGAAPVYAGMSKGGKHIYALSCPQDGSYLTIGRGEVRLYVKDEIPGFAAEVAKADKAAPAPAADPAEALAARVLQLVMTQMQAAPTVAAKRVKRVGQGQGQEVSR